MRAADVWAEQPCELLRLPAAAFRSLGLSSEGLAEHARTALRVHLRGSVPKSASLLVPQPATRAAYGKAPGLDCSTHFGGAPRPGGPQWRQMVLSSASQPVPTCSCCAFEHAGWAL